jgi:putative transcriptional regulator
MYNKLIGYRNMINLSQADICKALGIWVQTYSRKENGKFDFTLREAKIITKLLQREMPELTMEQIFEKTFKK